MGWMVNRRRLHGPPDTQIGGTSTGGSGSGGSGGSSGPLLGFQDFSGGMKPWIASYSQNLDE